MVCSICTPIVDATFVASVYHPAGSRSPLRSGTAIAAAAASALCRLLTAVETCCFTSERSLCSDRRSASISLIDAYARCLPYRSMSSFTCVGSSTCSSHCAACWLKSSDMAASTALSSSLVCPSRLCAATRMLSMMVRCWLRYNSPMMRSCRLSDSRYLICLASASRS